MNLEFEQTRQDIESFYLFHYWESDEKKLLRNKLRFGCGFVATIPVWLILLFGDGEKSVFGVIVFVTTLFLLGFSLVRNIVLNKVISMTQINAANELNEQLFRRRSIEFTPDKIIWSDQVSRGETDVKGLVKIVEGVNGFYLYINADTAFLVPKRIFQGDAQMQNFRNLLDNYRQRMLIQDNPRS
ncbi:MAG: YcxB family protein [Cyclobacteriaceae bacterium]|nr:YcxB family protein [Cyclobacteriaceae bacterium]